MKKSILTLTAALMAVAAMAQEGKPFIHDPSTIVECDGKYYTFGTGGGGLISEDGWTWNSGAQRPGGGAAPDAMKIGDRYLVAYSTTGGGLGGGHAGNIVTMWTKSLDPNSPDFGFSAPVTVAKSEYDEDCDAIDAGLLMTPDGRLFVSFGTYFGFIRMVELDPETGERKAGAKDVNVAIDCEASVPIYRDGWYYLLGTHGTCCDGVNSTYNIVVGRSRNPQGPFIDNVGRDMVKGGGKMVVSSDSRHAGAGHFGREIIDEGVEKCSFHWEADYDQSGRSVLAIRPLLWKNGWPVAGELFQEGTYFIESERRGYGLELAVDFVRYDTGIRRMFFGGNDNEPVVVLNEQKLEDVCKDWPEGDIEVRLGDYLGRPHQKWDIVFVPEAGGFLGGQYAKIVLHGTGKVLAATAEKEVIAVPEFTGAPEQLWKIEQLTDGTYRIMPKAVPGTDEELALISIADSTPTLGKFDFNSDNSKWNFKKNW